MKETPRADGPPASRKRRRSGRTVHVCGALLGDGRVRREEFSRPSHLSRHLRVHVGVSLLDDTKPCGMAFKTA